MGNGATGRPTQLSSDVMRRVTSSKTKVAYFLKDSSGEKRLKELLGEDWASDEF
jgi:hypothetical protein